MDIVDRLRAYNSRMGTRNPNDYGAWITVAELNEAADEIGRLRTIVRVNALRAGFTHADVDAVLFPVSTRPAEQEGEG